MRDQTTIDEAVAADDPTVSGAKPHRDDIPGSDVPACPMDPPVEEVYGRIFAQDGVRQTSAGFRSVYLWQ